MHTLKLELLHVIDRSNLSITNHSFSTKFGTLCFDMPGKGRWRGNTGGTGSTDGSGDGRKSRRRRRERRAALRDDAFLYRG